MLAACIPGKEKYIREKTKHKRQILNLIIVCIAYVLCVLWWSTWISVSVSYYHHICCGLSRISNKGDEITQVIKPTKKRGNDGGKKEFVPFFLSFFFFFAMCGKVWHTSVTRCQYHELSNLRERKKLLEIKTAHKIVYLFFKNLRVLCNKRVTIL